MFQFSVMVSANTNNTPDPAGSNTTIHRQLIMRPARTGYSACKPEPGLQRRSGRVKAATVLIFVFSATHVLAADSTVGTASSLFDFWRNIFARPGDDEISHVVTTPPARLALGRQLFADTRLSGKNDRACTSCHAPEKAFTDGLIRALGADEKPLPRNTPTLFNIAWGKSFNWDGSAPSLPDQARGPILHPNELGGSFNDIIDKLSADAQIRSRFAAAFPDDPVVSENNILAALEAYERTIISPPTRFDRWIDGDGDALMEAERAGFGLFVGKAGCVACHVGWRFTDERFHDIGLKSDKRDIDGSIAGKKGVMAFKTPTLRALTRTGPYMHDGSLATIGDVLDHYTNKIEERKGVSELLPRKLDLSRKEKDDLIAFLRTL